MLEVENVISLSQQLMVWKKSEKVSLLAWKSLMFDENVLVGLPMVFLQISFLSLKNVSLSKRMLQGGHT